MAVTCDVRAFVGVEEGPFEGWSLEWLELEICRTAANLTAAEARWLGLIAEFDRRQGWADHGSLSCAKWLQDQVGMERATAHEKVRVAHALAQFPTFALAMSAGVLSYAKVRSITRIATVDNSDMLLAIALERSSHEVERFVTAFRRCVASIANSGAASGRYLVTLHLSPDVFDDDTATDGKTADEGSRSQTTDHEADRDRRNVCCVAAGDGLGNHPGAVPRHTARRILCDAVLQGYKADAHGEGPLGTSQRPISAKLRRALRLRDGGCRAPGCDRMWWIDAHHIVHRLDGGPTVDSNLVCLCRFHHRLVHEGGWWITGDANSGGLRFHRPDGTILPTGQQLIIGNAKVVDDIGCTPAAVRPGASVHEQLDAIADARRTRQRCRDLRRRLAS